MTWSPNKSDYDRLRQVHHFMLLRCLGWRKRKRGDRTLSYANELAKTDSKSMEMTVQERRILFAGLVARMGGGGVCHGERCLGDWLGVRTTQGVLGVYGRDELNDNRERLLIHATDNKLALLNTHYATPARGI